MIGYNKGEGPEFHIGASLLHTSIWLPRLVVYSDILPQISIYQLNAITLNQMMPIIQLNPYNNVCFSF